MAPGFDMSETTWKANFPELYLWAEWNDEEQSVVFHQGSGETLLLSPLGAFLLNALCNEPHSEAALAQLAAHHFDMPLDEELTRTIDTTLSTFEQKGLILATQS